MARSAGLDLSPGDEVPLKDRVFSTWYRIRYGWQFRSSVEIGGTPIWLLGKCYHAQHSKGTTGSHASEGVPPHVLEFMEHYYSLPWMTYRTNFSPIPGTMLTSDCGWGCMVRSGQMMLAAALHSHLIGRDWRLPTSSVEDRTTHRQILSWFADTTENDSPFSLHAMMDQAQLRGHQPGDWFGPSQVAILIRDCLERMKRSCSTLDSLLIYVAHDCTVYIGDVLTLYGNSPDRALLVLVPVRLGGEALNPIYVPCVKSLLTLDHCVGIIGGRPKHSVYFVGFQDDKLVHLDPHYCQGAVDMKLTDFDIKSYHCNTPRKLAANRMDPSCTIGFLCKNMRDFRDFQRKTEPLLAPPLQRGVYPFFSFSQHQLGDVLESSVGMQFATLVGQNLPDGPRDEEDFVVVDYRTPSPLQGD